MVLLTNTLGHRVFESLISVESAKRKKLNTFFINATRGANGSGTPSSKGFIVYKNSEVAISTTESIQQSFKNFRQRLINDMVLVHKEGKLIFSKDYEFKSPSTAAAILMGRNANGLKEWKLKSGKTLKEFETND